MTGLLVHVFHDKFRNGGPRPELGLHGLDSALFDSFVLIDDHHLVGAGELGPFLPNAKTPALYLRPGNLRDGSFRAVPANPPGIANLIGPMFGGAFVYTSDSRFPKSGGTHSPIPVHDRWESDELYSRNFD